MLKRTKFKDQNYAIKLVTRFSPVFSMKESKMTHTKEGAEQVLIKHELALRQQQGAVPSNRKLITTSREKYEPIFAYNWHN